MVAMIIRKSILCFQAFPAEVFLMKIINSIRGTFSRLLQKKQNKVGSSLAFVVIVGAALVIWMTCVIPLMNGTGANSKTMSGIFQDYITSRSSIEFCKSELEKIVETDSPYTFCVVQDDSGLFSAIPKKLSLAPNPAYSALI